MNEQVKILVVDDEESIRETLKEILEDEGYIVDTVKNGRTAIKFSKEKSYDLALIDNRLPDIEGIELLEKFKESNSNMIKIVVTGFPSTTNAVKALNNGANRYLLKPVKSINLINISQEELNKREEIEKINEDKVAEFIENRVMKLARQ